MMYCLREKGRAHVRVTCRVTVVGKVYPLYDMLDLTGKVVLIPEDCRASPCE